MIKKLLKLLSIPLYRLVNQGVKGNLSIREASRVRLTNSIAIFLIINTVLGIILGKHLSTDPIIVQWIAFLLYSASIMLNHFQKYLLAKVLLIGSVNMVAFFFSYYFTDTFTYLFFIPTAFLGFILFRKKEFVFTILSTSLSLSLFAIWIWLDIGIFGVNNLGQANISVINKVIITEIFVVCLLLLYYMFVENNRAASLLAKEIKKFQQSEIELAKYYQANLYLTQSTFIRKGNLQEALNIIAQTASETLQVSRVNIWQFDDNYTQITCLAHYDSEQKENLIGTVIKAVDYPIYFYHLSQADLLVAPDARNHEFTKEFKESYLEPADIYSLLDVPIKIEGKMQGIVCFEQTKEKKYWTINEKEFGLSIASIAALAMETATRKQINAQLIQSLEAKDMILNILAHDLKNPISGTITACDVIKNTADKIQDQDAKSEIEMYAELITQSQQHAHSIIQDLLESIKLESENPTTFLIERTELNDFIHPIFNSFTAKAKNKQIQLTHNFYQRTLYVNINPTKFERLIDNLMTNAIKFTPKGGKVSLLLHAGNHHHLIIVQDNGIGIPLQDQAIIFNKFTKAKRKGTEGEPTNGLGLFICKQIVEMHKGEIWVESKEGQGSAFYVKIPKA